MKREETEAWRKPKNGSVFPAKKRSVKRMIWNQFVDSMKGSSSMAVSPPPPQSSMSNSNVHPCSTSS
ncbi:hypothetical protein RYX36_014641 [Vicia faba]